MRYVSLGAGIVALTLVGFMLLMVGEFVATGATLSRPSINAFLFLAGLGVVLRLLSPAPFVSQLRERRYPRTLSTVQWRAQWRI